jgi:hypothetical protein
MLPITAVNSSTSQAAVITIGAAEFEMVAMREKLHFLRDIAIVLGLQIVFRTMMFLQKLNY